MSESARSEGAGEVASRGSGGEHHAVVRLFVAVEVGDEGADGGIAAEYFCDP